MPILKTSTTGFENPAERLSRLLPTSKVLHQLKTAEEAGDIVNNCANRALESFKDIGYWLALDDFYQASNKQRERDLHIAYEVTRQQLNMPGLTDLAKEKWSLHLSHVKELRRIYNKGWATEMFPMLEE